MGPWCGNGRLPHGTKLVARCRALEVAVVEGRDDTSDHHYSEEMNNGTCERGVRQLGLLSSSSVFKQRVGWNVYPVSRLDG